VPYYERDVNAVAALRTELEAVGLPLVRARKLNSVLNAIEMQVEDEYPDQRVVDALFGGLLVAAESIDLPAGEAVRKRIQGCRERVGDSLSHRVVGGG
jgi:hypothetical protein